MDLWPLFIRVGGVLTPVLVIAAAGYIWAKNDPEFKSRLIGDVALYVGVPGLLFSTLLKANVDPSTLALCAAAAAIFVFLSLSMIAGGMKAFGQPLNPAITGLGFANWGNLSMPICLFAFGDLGLAVGSAFFAVSIFLQFTLGWRLAAGIWPWRAIFTLPLLWALLAAVLLRSFDAMPPQWVMDTASLAGGAAIPCMLLALGGGIARMKPSSLPLGFLFAGLRLVLGLGVGYALITILPFPEETKPIVLLISIMPLAVFNYILAEKTDQDPGVVASYVVASIALSLIALPVGLAMWMP